MRILKSLAATAAALAAELGVDLRITVRGYTDRIGDSATNERLASARATLLTEAAGDAGMDVDAIRQETVIPDQGPVVMDLTLRRVTVFVSASE